MNRCYREDCDNSAPFAVSWRIRGPKEGTDESDRIITGNTATTGHSCEEHLNGMRDAARGLFRGPA